MKVSDILRVKGNTLYTVAPDEPLAQAIDTMADKDIGSLVVMDHGRFAAEGSPRDLIARYCSPEVLELRFDPELHDQAGDKLKDFPAERAELLADRILLYVTDGDEALAAVRETGLEPLTSLVRRGTLEDVFLYLTGRRLED